MVLTSHGVEGAIIMVRQLCLLPWMEVLSQGTALQCGIPRVPVRDRPPVKVTVSKQQASTARIE